MQLDCPATRTMVKYIFISYLALDILLQQQRTQMDIIPHLDKAWLAYLLPLLNFSLCWDYFGFISFDSLKF